MHATALITGASSGIGKELAHIHAERGGDLVIVARNRDALDALKTELETTHGISVFIIVADLTEEGATADICATLDHQHINIDYLINNAGIGGHGAFHERSAEEDTAMIALNCRALTELTHRILPGMLIRKRGKILNLASTAAYVPGPLQAVYYATKAYVLSLSEALAEELRGTQITVTALCPGPVKTGFATASKSDDLYAFKHGTDARSVAESGYDAMMKGKRIVFDKFRYFVVLRCVVPFLPRRIVTLVSKWTMQI